MVAIKGKIICYSDIISAKEALAMGVRKYVYKPLQGDELIDAVQEVLGCSSEFIINLNRSTVDLEVMRHIDELHLVEHPFMGARMLRDQLNREEFDVGHKINSYLLGDLAIEGANQVWVLETTYIPMA